MIMDFIIIIFCYVHDFFFKLSMLDFNFLFIVCPVLANESRIEKDKVLSALSDMEDAVQKLSHLSIELSTGSTDL